MEYKYRKSFALPNGKRKNIRSNDKADFERRCAEGDPHALMLREKGQNGTLSRRYWELFAECSIEEAEAIGRTSRTTVNGISVYDDDFE